MYPNRYSITSVNSKSNYKPGLPYDFTVKVANIDGSPVTDNKNQLYVSYSANYNDDKASKQAYPLSSNGLIPITLNFPVPSNSSDPAPYYYINVSKQIILKYVILCSK